MQHVPFSNAPIGATTGGWLATEHSSLPHNQKRIIGRSNENEEDRVRESRTVENRRDCFDFCANEVSSLSTTRRGERKRVGALHNDGNTRANRCERGVDMKKKTIREESE